MKTPQIEAEVSDYLNEARERADRHASPALGDTYLNIRLAVLEQTCLALARHLDEIRGSCKRSS